MGLETPTVKNSGTPNKFNKKQKLRTVLNKVIPYFNLKQGYISTLTRQGSVWNRTHNSATQIKWNISNRFCVY